MLKVAVKKKKDDLELFNLKLTPEQKRALQAKADKYTNGNLSLWLRYAGAMYVPSKKELA